MTDRNLPPTASVASTVAGDKLHAPAATRNTDVIAALLERVAPRSGDALELASGTGQHIVQFATRLPQLTWQPTDIAPERLASIAAYASEMTLSNLRKPYLLNATRPGWADGKEFDLIVLVNLLHLISTPEAKTLVSEVTKALRPDGTFVLYGPFMRNRVLTSDGDRSFHASLTASDPAIGYKNDQDVIDWMKLAGLSLDETVEMPDNNLSIIAQRS